MKDHLTRPDSDDSRAAEFADTRDDIEISDLPPEASAHHILHKLTAFKRHLLALSRDVSRGTLQNDVSLEDEAEAVEESKSEDEGLDLVISDLPPTRRSHYLVLKLDALRSKLPAWGTARARKTPLTPAARRRRASSVFATLGICAALLVLLLGNLPGLRAQMVSLVENAPAPTPTPTSIAYPRFSRVHIYDNQFGSIPPNGSLDSPGSLPATCPQISTLQYFTTPLDPPGLGASPLWLSGFTGPSAALNDLRPVDAQIAHASWPGGWYEAVAVFIQKGYPDSITLQGSSQQGGEPIWLSRNNPQVLSTTLTLNLSDGGQYIANGQWEMTTINIVVPRADCYTLQATWSNSSWVRFFAAGR